MNRLRTLCVSVVVAIATTMAATTVASADPVASQGNTTGTKYRGGVAGNGGISYAAGLQVTHDAAGTVKVRAAGRISKISKASKVQVDRVALGTATAAVTKNNVPHGSGAANSVISYTNWKTLAPNTCTGYRTRADFSVRWTDGALSKFSVLSPLSTVCGKKTIKTCPTPKDVQPLYSNLVTVTKCYSANSWILTAGLYPSGDPIDGITVIHQTSPGKYVRAFEGSDFSGTAASLRSRGVPASLITLLVNGTYNFNGGIISYPRSAYTATWERHTSLLQIGSSRGAIHLGSGCCNSISLPLTYAMDSIGVLRGTVNGPASYTGTEFNNIHVAVGTAFYFHFAPGATGPVLVSSDPVFSGGPLVWCGNHYDSRCGA